MAARTFTQAEVNSLVARERREAAAKYADYDELRERAEQFDALVATAEGYAGDDEGSGDGDAGGDEDAAAAAAASDAGGAGGADQGDQGDGEGDGDEGGAAAAQAGPEADAEGQRNDGGAGGGGGDAGGDEDAAAAAAASDAGGAGGADQGDQGDGEGDGDEGGAAAAQAGPEADAEGQRNDGGAGGGGGDLAAENAQLRTQLLRQQIAAQRRLDPDLWDKVAGDTPDAIAADVARLVAKVGAASAPHRRGVGYQSGASAPDYRTPKERAAAAMRGLARSG